MTVMELVRLTHTSNSFYPILSQIIRDRNQFTVARIDNLIMSVSCFTFGEAIFGCSATHEEVKNASREHPKQVRAGKVSK